MTASGQLLIVEDSAVQRVMLQRLLQEAGYTVLAAKDGAEGLALTQAHRPALVISDIAMPGMDGYAMCRAIKNDAQLAAIPVLLLTGLDDPKEVIRGLEAGADNYLTKPVEDAHLLERIRMLLELPMEAPGGLEQQEGLQIAFAGELHVIHAGRRQTMNLLLSTYENAVRKNRELIQAKQALSLLTNHLEQEVQRRTRQLEVANRVKTEFISNMSHEVRTPMNAIIGMTDLVLASELTDRQREMLTIARSASDKLLRLLNSLLDFSRLEEGKLEVKVDLFSLRAFLQDVGQSFLDKAAAKGLGFCCRVAPQLPDGLIGDALRIRQVLDNLLDNALKFTERGGVCLEVTPLGAEGGQLAVVEDRFGVSFAVTDSGVGIEADRQEWIFESFTQGDGSHTRKYGGSGLGLSLAKRLTEAMEGRLSFRSEWGRGSVFKLQVALPYDPGSVPELAAGTDDAWQVLVQTAVATEEAVEVRSSPCAGGGGESEQALLAECHRLLALCERAIHGGRLKEIDQWIAPLRQVGARFLSGTGEGFAGHVLHMAMAARNDNTDRAMFYLYRARDALTS
ncbi:MAG: response regulator [Magnetococcales bacterium]|nr:response regulator [Magnetococcales bacterium]